MSATAPTQPRAPRPFEPAAGSAGDPARKPADPAAPDVQPDHTPWYRRAWVLAVGAVLLALLSFGSGFVAGTAASLFDGVLGGPGRGVVDGGPGFPDGVRPGDGDFPGIPGDPTSQSG